MEARLCKQGGDGFLDRELAGQRGRAAALERPGISHELIVVCPGDGAQTRAEFLGRQIIAFLRFLRCSLRRNHADADRGAAQKPKLSHTHFLPLDWSASLRGSKPEDGAGMV
jgi:hypothetical protein